MLSVCVAKPYEVDSLNSEVGFSVSHMSISNVTGVFKHFESELEWHPKKTRRSKIVAVIDVGSIDTRNLRRDTHLLSEDFFDSENYPEIVFESKRIKKAKKNKYKVEGLLTIKGITKPVKFPLYVKGPIVDPWGSERIGFEAEMVINRFDFGLSHNEMLGSGGLIVGSDVEIRLSIEAVEFKPLAEDGARGGT